MAWDYLDSHDLKLSNRPVRTRMPGGVAGVPPKMEAPYADEQGVQRGDALGARWTRQPLLGAPLLGHASFMGCVPHFFVITGFLS